MFQHWGLQFPPKSTQFPLFQSNRDEIDPFRGFVGAATTLTHGPSLLINGIKRHIPLARILEAELYPTLLSKARNFGMSDFWIQETSRETFIQKIEKDRKIMSRIQLLQQTGWISMDNEQFQFLARIMKHPLETDTKWKSSTLSLATSKANRTDENAAIIIHVMNCMQVVSLYIVE
ncbi:uncharacterized protein [Henckelia pumila]|uniref:uncharacterized protein n=1 Tax=Henckelia pumila TaxID=405737 RepID=UPI003C6E9955